MCNERRDLRRESASSIRVAVRFDTVWAIYGRSPPASFGHSSGSSARSTDARTRDERALETKYEAAGGAALGAARKAAGRTGDPAEARRRIRADARQTEGRSIPAC